MVNIHGMQKNLNDFTIFSKINEILMEKYAYEGLQKIEIECSISLPIVFT